MTPIFTSNFERCDRAIKIADCDLLVIGDTICRAILRAKTDAVSHLVFPIPRRYSKRKKADDRWRSISPQGAIQLPSVSLAWETSGCYFKFRLNLGKCLNIVFNPALNLQQRFNPHIINRPSTIENVQLEKILRHVQSSPRAGKEQEERAMGRGLCVRTGACARSISRLYGESAGGRCLCMCNLPKGLKRVTVNNQEEIIAVPVDE